MHLAPGFASARVINWGNLCVCCVVLIVSHIYLSHVFRSVDSAAGTIYHSNRSSKLLLNFHQVSLPPPAIDCVFLYRGWHGRRNLALKLEQLFTTPLQPFTNASSTCPSPQANEQQEAPCIDDGHVITLSDVYEHVLLRIESTMPSTMSSTHPGTSYATPSYVQNVLHLCSSSSCVGPYVLSLFDKRVALRYEQSNTAGVYDDGHADHGARVTSSATRSAKWLRLKLYTLVHGEVTYAQLIRDDLNATGVSSVIVPTSPDNVGDAIRQHGIASAARKNDVTLAGNAAPSRRDSYRDDGQPSDTLYGVDGLTTRQTATAPVGHDRGDGTHVVPGSTVCSHCDKCGCRYARGFANDTDARLCVLHSHDPRTGNGAAHVVSTESHMLVGGKRTMSDNIQSASRASQPKANVPLTTSPSQQNGTNHHFSGTVNWNALTNQGTEGDHTLHRSTMSIERYDAAVQHESGQIACSVPGESGWYRTEVKPFEQAIFSDSTRLSNLTVHLTHIESDCEHALATMTFLTGLATLPKQNTISSTHILLPLCLTEWTASTLRVMQALHKERNYNILLMFGDECHPHVRNSTATVTIHDMDRMIQAWDASSATRHFANFDDPTSEPLCLFLLTQKYTTFRDLIEQVRPTPYYTSRLRRFFDTIPEETTDNDVHSVYLITAMKALWFTWQENITIIVLLVPVCIALLLILGATKKCRR